MDELRTEEIMETVNEAADDVMDNIVENGGLGFGKAAGLLGCAVLLGTGIYMAVKHYKKKKAEKIDGDIVESECTETVVEE